MVTDGGLTLNMAVLGGIGGILALRAHCTLLLDYVPPEEPPGTPIGNGRGSTPTIFPPIEFQRQHHSSKNKHDAHLPTKPPQSTPLLQRGDEHTYEVECA